MRKFGSFRKTSKTFLITAVLLALTPCAFATQAPNLMDVFNQALSGDPQWMAYKSTLLSNKENTPIALSLLLPNLSASGVDEYNIRNQRAQVPNNPGFGVGTFHYATNDYTLQLTQTIFNFANWEQFQSARAQVKQATAQYGAEYQALMVQVAQAYFNVLEARDVLNYTITERKAVNQLYQQNLERYHVGLGTITDVYNAKANLDNTISQEIAAKTNLLNNIEALRAITGRTYTSLAGLQQHVPLLLPNPNNVEQWVSISMQQNLTVLAARYAIDAARETVKQQFAGHLPTVNAVASYAELHAGNNGFGTTNEGDTAVGVQLQIPLFAGGGVVAQTDQAQYNYQTALSNHEEALRTAAENARQSFNNVVSGVNRVKADLQALVSNTSSLTSTEAAFKVGTRSMIDVLTAQTQLFNTQITYANDLYSYLINILTLKQAAGTLTPQDLLAINKWLTLNAPLTGYYESLYTETVPNALNPSTLQHQPSTTQRQQIQQAAKSLPVFTPQPQSQWTQPAASTAPPINTMAPVAPLAPASPSVPVASTTAPTTGNLPNGQFVPPSLAPTSAAIVPALPTAPPLRGTTPPTTSTESTEATLPTPQFESPAAQQTSVPNTNTTTTSTPENNSTNNTTVKAGE